MGGTLRRIQLTQTQYKILLLLLLLLLFISNSIFISTTSVHKPNLLQQSYSPLDPSGPFRLFKKVSIRD